MKAIFGKILRNLFKKAGYTFVSLKHDPLISSYPMGEFYSPVLSKKDILKRRDEIFDRSRTEIPGIDLNETIQRALIQELKPFYSEIDFPENKTPGYRYFTSGGPFPFSDAACLQMMMRKYKPGQIMEVGSGFSSAVMLDTNDKFLNKQIECTFIDPDPSRLLNFMTDEDVKNHKVLAEPIQDVDLTIFEKLGPNDIFFIDSSHVAKTGSDVNFIYFEILPRLKPGVLVHVHDIFYPFEYLSEWVMEGWGWNEAYLLRAFLQFNEKFKILLFGSYLEHHHGDWLKAHMPKVAETLPHSIWLQRV